MDTMISIDDPKLDPYRSFSHDAVMLYGFTMKDATTGAVKTKFTIKDGLKYVLVYKCENVLNLF